jgi:hypothetical protein
MDTTSKYKSTPPAENDGVTSSDDTFRESLGVVDQGLGVGGVGDSNNNSTPNNRQDDLPFLVTHWLANYGRLRQRHDDDNDAYHHHPRQRQEEEDALSTIRRATAELASAFSSLGAYGTTIRVRTVRIFLMFCCCRPWWRRLATDYLRCVFTDPYSHTHTHLSVVYLCPFGFI